MADDKQILKRLVQRMKTREQDPLRPLLDAYLMTRGLSPERHVTEPIMLAPPTRPGGRLSPSSLGGCQRQAVFRFVGVQGRVRVDPDSELIFDDGNWRHHKWQAIFRDMELVLGPERFKVLGIEEHVTFPDLYIAGSLDARLLLNGKTKCILDIKGINNAGFDRITRADEPIKHHVEQLSAYMRARRTKLGILLYDNKNTNHTKVFLVSYENEHWERVADWAREVVDALEAKTLPKRHPDCRLGTFSYEVCPWKRLCFGHQAEDEDRVKRYAYKRFKGVEAHWEAGNEAIRTSRSSQRLGS